MRAIEVLALLGRMVSIDMDEAAQVIKVADDGFGSVNLTRHHTESGREPTVLDWRITDATLLAIHDLPPQRLVMNLGPLK